MNTKWYKYDIDSVLIVEQLETKSFIYTLYKSDGSIVRRVLKPLDGAIGITMMNMKKLEV